MVAGNQALELNDATTNIAQTLGVTRTVATTANEVYTLSFDYAGRLGFGTDYTRIKVTVDGVPVNFAAQSSLTSLSWQTLSFSFMGDGTNKTISIETDPLAVNSAGRGALIDDIVLNHADGVMAGNAVAGTKTDIVLSKFLGAALADTDGSEVLSLTLDHLPTGAQIVTSSGTVTPINGTATFLGADLATATLRLDSGFVGNLELSVSATATESSNGSTATSAAQVLSIEVGPHTGATTSPALVVFGGAGADLLLGDANANTLYGGKGNDTLTGGTAADTFRWSLGDHGANGTPAVDTITDFNAATPAAGGDILDLRDLLQGELHGAPTGSNVNGTVGTLENYLDFSVAGGTTTLRVSSAGSFTGGTYSAGAEDQRIVLQGVDIRSALGLAGTATDAQIIQELLNRGKIVTDGP